MRHPRPTPTLATLCAALLLAAGAWVYGAQHGADVAANAQADAADAPDAPADKPDDKPPVFDTRNEHHPLHFSRLLPSDPPRALRRVGGGLELYEIESGRPMRRYLPQRRITTWKHVSGDRWWVAFAGGEVVEIDFDGQTQRPAMSFDGDVFWLNIESQGLATRVIGAIAEHSVRGVGTVRLLYFKDAETGELQATVLDESFASVREDDYGRAWLQPQPGDLLSELRYLSVATGEINTVTVPRSAQRTQRCFGGITNVPGGPTLVWGATERAFGPPISWVAELSPPMFDDAVWQDSTTFATTGLPTERVSGRSAAEWIRLGRVTLAYDPLMEQFALRDHARDEAWVARESLDFWVEERYAFALRLGNPNALDAAPRDHGRPWETVPELEEDWADAFVHRLLEPPVRRIAHLDRNAETDPLLDMMLRDVAGRGRDGFFDEVHVTAGCDDAWIVGLDSGVIVQMSNETGRFEKLAEVRGLPFAIDLKDNQGDEALVVDYWPQRMEAPRRAAFLQNRRGRWVLENDEPIEDRNPYIWTDRRSVELYFFGRESSRIDWTDQVSMIRSIFTTVELGDSLALVGLLDMPDGRVIGYGTDRQMGNDAPVLVDVTRGRKGIVWHRDYGFYPQNADMPTVGITHAVYIPEARRVLMIAGDKVFSTDRWLGDWRVEREIRPEGFEEADDHADEGNAG